MLPLDDLNGAYIMYPRVSPGKVKMVITRVVSTLSRGNMKEMCPIDSSRGEEMGVVLLGNMLLGVHGE